MDWLGMPRKKSSQHDRFPAQDGYFPNTNLGRLHQMRLPPFQVVLSSFALLHYERVYQRHEGTKCHLLQGLILKIKALSSLNGSLSRSGVVMDVLQTRRISTQTANHYLRGSYRTITTHVLLKFKQDFSLKSLASLFRVKRTAVITTQPSTVHAILCGTEQTVFLGIHSTFYFRIF